MHAPNSFSLRYLTNVHTPDETGVDLRAEWDTVSARPPVPITYHNGHHDVIVSNMRHSRLEHLCIASVLYLPPDTSTV